MIKKQTEYIEDAKGVIYLPRPSNWLSGWLRSRWFKHHTKAHSVVASPDTWSTLQRLYIVRTLTEYENGDIKLDEKR